MAIFNYRVTTKAGYASGSLEATSEEEARKFLSQQYEGELQDNDGNPFNNDVESIDLVELKD